MKRLKKLTIVPLNWEIANKFFFVFLLNVTFLKERDMQISPVNSASFGRLHIANKAKFEKAAQSICENSAGKIDTLDKSLASINTKSIGANYTLHVNSAKDEFYGALNMGYNVPAPKKSHWSLYVTRNENDGQRLIAKTEISDDATDKEFDEKMQKFVSSVPYAHDINDTVSNKKINDILGRY